MASFLLFVIYIAFIGLGLPDSLFGTAWPAIYADFDLPISYGSFITSTVACGTIVSSLVSARLIHKFGTNKVAAVSTLLTAVALIGFSFSTNIWFMILLAIPLGLGAGAIDVALNNYVALHYSAKQMSFLHCFYGVGVTLSPYLVSLAVGDGNNWRKAYLTVGILQSVIAMITVLVIPYWKKKEKMHIESEDKPAKALSLLEMIKMPSVVLSCIVFYIICATEYTAGVWSSTFFAEYKDFTPEQAARTAMLFYVGMTLGRFMSGVFGNKLGSKRILYICVGILLSACVIIALPLPSFVAAAGLLLFGFGMGPAFPNLSYLVPSLFGKDISS